MDGIFAHIFLNKSKQLKIVNSMKISINQIFKINMQISLPIYSVNHYLIVYINTIISYLYLEKTNSINNREQFY